MVVYCNTIFANEETEAYRSCENYNMQLKQHHITGEFVMPCKMNSRSSNQWNCMTKRQVDMGWSFSEAVGTCFKDAPALSKFNKYEMQLSTTEPKTLCEKSVKLFRQYHPDDKSLDLIYSLCRNSERTSVEWLCMEHLAEGKNSFNYSTGQCFPNDRG